MTKRKKKKRQIKITNMRVFFLPTILVGICFISIGLIFATPSKPTSIKIALVKPTPTPTSMPTPTINPFLQDTFRTYTNDLYIFSVTYPALGINEQGNLTACGSNIQQELFVTHDSHDNAIVFPKFTFDSFYTISLHPWGGELQDYILQRDSHAETNTPFTYNVLPHIDEAVLFEKPTNSTSYFGETLALYKKGNLIFQLDTTTQKGCQMLFDPRNHNQTALRQITSLQLSFLFSQYRNWNEATSISFGSSSNAHIE